jgi:Tryptophan halogenase
MSAQYEAIRDFIILHYKITQRTDSEFWKHCAAMSIPDTLAHQIELFRATGRVTILAPEGFSESSHEAILLGLGVTPQTYDPFVDAIDEVQLRAHFARLREDIAQFVARTPDHGDFVARQVRADAQPASH